MYKVKQALKITSDLIYKSFAPRSSSIYHKIPYVSIILFILAIVCCSIQKTSNDYYYIQNIISGKDDNMKKQIDPVSAFFLKYLDTMGVNRFLGVNRFFDMDELNITIESIFFLISYLLLMTIEMNIGHAYLAYFIIVLMLYNTFSISYHKLVCFNGWDYDRNYIFLYATSGCALAILLSYAHGLMMKSIILFIILLSWGIIILVNYYNTFQLYSNEHNLRTCISFYWGGMIFIFGVLSGLVMVQ